jgi:hypothetical protein
MGHSAGHSAHSPRWFAIIAIGMALVSFLAGLLSYTIQGGKPLSEATFRSLQMFHVHFHGLPYEKKPGFHEELAEKRRALSEKLRAEVRVKAGEAPSGLPLADPAAEAGVMKAVDDTLRIHYQHKEWVPPVLDVARHVAAVLALGLIPAMLGLAIFRGAWLRYSAKHRWKDHAVVFGQCMRTLSLIHDLQRTGSKVVLIGHCPTPENELPAGVLYFPAGPDPTQLLDDAGLRRASRLVALHEEDRANLEILVAAAAFCEKHRPEKLPPLECSAHLQDIHLKIGLHQRLAALRSTRKLRVHLFNYYEVVARMLACQYPLPEAVVESKPLPEHYVIIGFGSFGQNVALKLIKMGQQLVRRREAGEDRWEVVKPRVTVVDPKGEARSAVFLRSHPSFADHCDLRFENISTDSKRFLDLEFLSEADAEAKTSVIFCLENEAVALPAALMLQALCQTRQRGKDVDAIYLRIAHPERLGMIERDVTTNATKPRIIFFAPDAEIFTAGSLLLRNVDVLAREVHRAWLPAAKKDVRANNQPSAADSAWEQLSEEDRNSNREAADHMWAKLRTLGYELRAVPEGEVVPPSSEILLNDLAAREEELARAEHYRWMTWRLINGWTYGPNRTTEAELAAGMPKHHPDILPYEKLGDAVKEKDRVVVRSIPNLLRAGRLVAVRRM